MSIEATMRFILILGFLVTVGVAASIFVIWRVPETETVAKILHDYPACNDRSTLIVSLD